MSHFKLVFFCVGCVIYASEKLMARLVFFIRIESHCGCTKRWDLSYYVLTKVNKKTVLYFISICSDFMIKLN